MIRVQVHLTTSQNKKLEALARELGAPKAELIREGVDLVLRQKVDEAKDPLLELVGQAGEVGRSDLSIRHDAYLSALQIRRKKGSSDVA